jgi:Selenocysteine lyase
MTFDPGEIRADFPILEHIIYLDSAATSLSPRQVIEAQADAEYHFRANVGRGVHRMGRLATHKFEASRAEIASFFGGASGTLAFTRNTTEGINIIANGLDWNPRDRVIVPLQEHHSNILPWFSCRNWAESRALTSSGARTGISAPRISRPQSRTTQDSLRSVTRQTSSAPSRR